MQINELKAKQAMLQRSIVGKMLPGEDKVCHAA